MTDPGCYGSAVNRASDLLYEVSAWLHDVTSGERDADEMHAALDGRLVPAADAALTELRTVSAAPSVDSMARALHAERFPTHSTCEPTASNLKEAAVIIAALGALSGGSPKGEQRDDRAHGRDCAGPDCGDSENGYCGCWCHMNPALVAPAGSGGSLKPPKDGNE